MATPASTDARLDFALAWLRAQASAATRAGLARYAISDTHALGVSVADLKRLGKDLGRDHPLAQALWKTGIYEARMLTQFVADPARQSAAEMDRWVRQIDTWALCDALAFNLFDRSPHAWPAVQRWCAADAEFVRRSGFALLWALALHDREATDDKLRMGLALCERHAGDGRNFVTKAIAMALRALARRRTLDEDLQAVAQRLAASDDPARRRLGRGLPVRGRPRCFLAEVAGTAARRSPA